MLNLGYRSTAFGRDFVHSSILPKGVTYESTLPIKFPSWSSWMGLGSWIEIISKEFGWSKERAKIALMSPKDCQWVAELSEQEVSKIGWINPFKYNWCISAIRHWLASYQNMMPLHDFLEEPFDTRLNPKSAKCVRLANALSWDFHPDHGMLSPKDIAPINGRLSSKDITPLICRWFNSLSAKQLHKYDDIDMYLMSLVGHTSPAEKKFYKWFVGGGSAPYCVAPELFTQLFRAIDMRYISENEYCTVSALLRGGVHPSVLLPNFTKAEAIAICNDNRDIHPRDVISNFLTFWMRSCTSLPEGWLCEIRTKEVADWAIRHQAQLAKTRVIYGPGGASRTMYYHELLREITPDMLSNGAKTAWRKVMSRLEATAMARIKQELGENVDLPQLKHPTVSGCIQIKTSEQLGREGEKMGHCVGGYVGACLSGISYIYHVGAPAPNGITVEIGQSQGQSQGKYVIHQQLGRENQLPRKDQTELATRLIDVINAVQQ